jgi:hypothetical protein
MAVLDVQLIGDGAIREFYSEVFIRTFQRSFSHDSVSEKDLETAALQAKRIAEVATRVRAGVESIEI